MFNIFGSLLGTKRKAPSISSDDDEEDGDDSNEWASDANAEAGEEAAAEAEAARPESPIPFGTSTLAQKLTQILPDADVRCPRVVIVGGQSSGKTKMIINLLFHYLIDNKSFTDEMGEKLLKIFRTGNKMVTRRPTTVQFRKKDDGSSASGSGSSSDPPVTPLPAGADVSADSCDITIKLGDQSACLREDEAAFNELVDRVTHESTIRDGRAFGGEFKVVIAAPGLPNMSFTDLPGLITDDRVLSEKFDHTTSDLATEGSSSSQYQHHQTQQEEQQTIRKMVQRFMEMKNTTLVVVEPASIEDFETSQVSPLLRDIKRSGRRKDIFEHSVLVLSKCDKVRQGYEQRIMQMIDLSAPQIDANSDFPYKHVVGVINKVDDPIFSLSHDDAVMESFAAFKADFKKTKAHETERFADFRNSNGSSCDTSKQCTTAAVFHHMDRISFEMVHLSLVSGEESLDKKISKVEDSIRQKLAPPLWYYDEKQRTSTTAQPAVAGNADYNQQQHQFEGRAALIAEVQCKLERLLTRDLRHSHPYELNYLQLQRGTDSNSSNGSTADFQSGLQTRYDFIVQSLGGVEWATFQSGDMLASTQQYEALAAMKRYYHRFISETVARSCLQCLTCPADGCFSAANSPFHRIDRFPNFCNAMRDYMQSNLPACVQFAKEKVSTFLAHQWDFEVPRGTDAAAFVGYFDQLFHIAVRSMFHQVVRMVNRPQVRQLVLGAPATGGGGDAIFEESAEFVVLRAKLGGRWEHLQQQREILRSCMHVRSNEELRDALDAAAEKLQSQRETADGEKISVSSLFDTSAALADDSKIEKRLSEDSDSLEKRQWWLDFWRTAEQASIEQVRLADEVASAAVAAASSAKTAIAQRSRAAAASKEHPPKSPAPARRYDETFAATPDSAVSTHRERKQQQPQQSYASMFRQSIPESLRPITQSMWPAASASLASVQAAATAVMHRKSSSAKKAAERQTQQPTKRFKPSTDEDSDATDSSVAEQLRQSNDFKFPSTAVTGSLFSVGAASSNSKHGPQAINSPLRTLQKPAASNNSYADAADSARNSNVCGSSSTSMSDSGEEAAAEEEDMLTADEGLPPPAPLPSSSIAAKAATAAISSAADVSDWIEARSSIGGFGSSYSALEKIAPYSYTTLKTDYSGASSNNSNASFTADAKIAVQPGTIHIKQQHFPATATPHRTRGVYETKGYAPSANEDVVDLT